jgi:hypothetical protein
MGSEGKRGGKTIATKASTFLSIFTTSSFISIPYSLPIPSTYLHPRPSVSSPSPVLAVAPTRPSKSSARLLPPWPLILLTPPQPLTLLALLLLGVPFSPFSLPSFLASVEGRSARRLTSSCRQRPPILPCCRKSPCP